MKIRFVLAACVALAFIALGGLAFVAIAQGPAIATARALAVPSGQGGLVKSGSASIVERANASDLVVVGKVIEIEKEPFNVMETRTTAAFGALPLQARIVKIKIESPLMGPKNLTHIKVAFRTNSGEAPALDDKFLMFLKKEEGKDYYISPPFYPPVHSRDEKLLAAAILQVEQATAAIKDPMKALKAEKAGDRLFAATALLGRYQQRLGDGRKYEAEAIPEDESKLILKILAEADWKVGDNTAAFPAFHSLNLTVADGWKNPVLKPDADTGAAYKKAFAEWLDGPGKEYRIKKYVPKAK